MFGIDTSWAQGAITPPADAQFNITCAARANVGLRVDRFYQERVVNTRAAGIKLGHYFFNGNQDPTVCANFLVDNLHDYRSGDWIGIDCEDEAATGTTAWGPGQVLAFGQVLSSRLNIPAADILVYMNRAVNHRFDWTPVVNAGYSLWYARPDGNPTDQAYWPSWLIRQTGIVGGLDRNETVGNTTASTGTPIPITPFPLRPTMKEADMPNAAIVRNFQAEKQRGEVATALIYPDGTAVLLHNTEDIDSAVVAHLQVYGLPVDPISVGKTTPRDRCGGQVNDAQWTEFWAHYPGTKIGF